MTSLQAQLSLCTNSTVLSECIYCQVVVFYFRNSVINLLGKMENSVCTPYGVFGMSLHTLCSICLYHGAAKQQRRSEPEFFLLTGGGVGVWAPTACLAAGPFSFILIEGGGVGVWRQWLRV